MAMAAISPLRSAHSTGVINWLNADLVTHIVPRANARRLAKTFQESAGPSLNPALTNRDASLQPDGRVPATTSAGEFDLLHAVFRDC